MVQVNSQAGGREPGVLKNPRVGPHLRGADRGPGNPWVGPGGPPPLIVLGLEIKPSWGKKL